MGVLAMSSYISPYKYYDQFLTFVLPRNDSEEEFPDKKKLAKVMKDVDALKVKYELLAKAYEKILLEQINSKGEFVRLYESHNDFVVKVANQIEILKCRDMKDRDDDDIGLDCDGDSDSDRSFGIVD